MKELIKMIITDIKESNTSNILKWALSNEADIKNDLSLMSFINDEMEYLVYIDDIDYLELYNLTSYYRDDVRVIMRHPSDGYQLDYLKQLFPGKIKIDNEEIDTAEFVDYGIHKFTDLSLQLKADTLNIDPSVSLMFIPMINRKFTVQIPVKFIDLIMMCTPKEYKDIFSDYPASLTSVINSNEIGFKQKLMMELVKIMDIKSYDKRLIQYLEITKYKALNNHGENRTYYSPELLSFYKKDFVSKKKNYCSLFKSTNIDMINEMKLIRMNRSDLEVEFAVQMPMEFMQILMNSYNNHILEIKFPSSFQMIIKNAFNFEYVISSKINSSVNIPYVVGLYRKRMQEAYEENLNIVNILLNESNNTDISKNSIAALFPSIYTTKAILKFNTNNIPLFKEHSNPFIKSMFNEIDTIVSNLKGDIAKAK